MNRHDLKKSENILVESPGPSAMLPGFEGHSKMISILKVIMMNNDINKDRFIRSRT